MKRVITQEEAQMMYVALTRISLAEVDGLDMARDSVVLNRAILIAKQAVKEMGAVKKEMPYIRVNYGINKKEGRRLTHRCGKMRIKGVWEDEATHKKIKDIIHRRHPGWSITGWCMWNATTSKTTEVRN